MPELQQALPKFLQIANHIRDEILRGEREPGDEVPSERAIADEWGVSRPTATRALQALRAQGLVESRQGSGSYVSSGEWADIVSARTVKAPAHIGASLGVGTGSRVVKRHRITNDESGPVEVSTSWFAEAVAQKAPRLLARERIREGTLAYVEGATGRRARTARDQIGTRLATSDEARELGLEEPVPVLVVHHIVYDAAGNPLEVAEAVYPPGGWTFEQDYPIAE
jgi:DNA-binding GntR family transcriptional regulator